MSEAKGGSYRAHSTHPVQKQVQSRRRYEASRLDCNSLQRSRLLLAPDQIAGGKVVHGQRSRELDGLLHSVFPLWIQLSLSERDQVEGAEADQLGAVCSNHRRELQSALPSSEAEEACLPTYRWCGTSPSSCRSRRVVPCPAQRSQRVLAQRSWRSSGFPRWAAGTTSGLA